MFYVYLYDVKPGKEQEIREWLKNRGTPYWKKIPEIKSVNTYIRHFGLGPRPQYQTWFEIEDLASLGSFLEGPRDEERQKMGKEFWDLVTNWSAMVVRKVA